MKRLLLFITAFMLIFSAEAQNSTKENPLVVFLVRHAEKVDSSRDPKLSVAGNERVLTLAATLANAEIEYIHSTDFIRTKNTVQPISELLNLEIEVYNPRDLQAFAKKLKLTGGRHLVVGHSNTTPKMVELLSGESGSEINEKSEYDRLYVVSVSINGKVNTVLLRYGNMYNSEKNH